MNKIILEDMKYLYQYDSDMWRQLNNRSVLVTGAYGMLPSYMVFMLIYLNEYIEDFNTEIICIVRDEKKLRSRFGEYIERPYFKTIIGDVVNPILYDGKIDYIIHGASPASSQFYGVNPVGVLLPNVLGTYQTLEVAREKKVRGYLFFSSGEIYGQLEKELIHENDCGGLDPTDVRSCYGEGKRAGEIMCKCYAHQYHIPTRMVRPCHTYGPTMDITNDNRVFAEFVSNVVQGKDIVMKSDGSAVRIFCYIADAVLGYFMVLLNGRDGEAYNVANSEGRCSIRELAQILCELFPEKHLSVICETRSDSYLENQHKVHPAYSTEKIEKLGWKTHYSLEAGFKRTVESFIT